MACSSGSAADSPSIVQTSPSPTLVEWWTRICASAVTRGSLMAEGNLASRPIRPASFGAPFNIKRVAPGGAPSDYPGAPGRRAGGHEQGVDAAVVGELRVERDREDRSVPDRDRMTVDLGEDLHLRPVLFHPWSPDEDRSQGLLPQALDRQILLETLELAAEGVAAAGVVGERQVVAVADDHPRAAAQNRPARLGVRANRSVEAVALEAHRDRGGLPAGNHQAVEIGELFRGPDLGCLRSQGLQRPSVRLEVALDGEDANAKAALAQIRCHDPAADRRPRRAPRSRARASRLPAQLRPGPRAPDR